MNIGFIGCGERLSIIFREMRRYDSTVKLKAVTDINQDYAKSKLLRFDVDVDDINWYTNAEDMLENEELDGVAIGTSCSHHAKLATLVLKRNLTLFLEKPVATTLDDLKILKNAYELSSSKTVVSFPLRVTPHIMFAKKIIDSGELGEISQIQAVNNVFYGRVYFKDWYRNEKETGGMFLQKSVHDFDCINYLVGQKPVKLCAMNSKQIFKGSKPANMTCDNCDEKYTCSESSFVIPDYMGDNYRGGMCSYAVDTGNEDSGSAIIMYESGLHAVYTQNFVTRKPAGKRMIRLIGYKGTLEFDWVSDILTVYKHDTDKKEVYKIDGTNSGHGGGDIVLAGNFIELIKGNAEEISSLDDGILSTLMALKAKESAAESKFKDICF